MKDKKGGCLKGFLITLVVVVILLIGFIIWALNAPSSEPANTNQEKIEEEIDELKRIAYVNETKEDAVQADFVELSSDNPPIDKKVFLIGEV